MDSGSRRVTNTRVLDSPTSGMTVHKVGIRLRMQVVPKFPCWIIGLMSGTSADGVDAALLFTDGRDIAEPGPSLTIAYSDSLRVDILNLMNNKGDILATSKALTEVHVEAVEKLRSQIKEPVALLGFHGQTIKHAPKQGITRQIGDAKMLLEKTGISLVNDFRSRDVREGGQGAPLVPLYHAALAKKLPKPLMIVNIGGVANVTWLGEGESRSPQGEPERSERGGAVAGAKRPPSRSDHSNIIAFDCGPGNALIDDWMHAKTGQRFDEEGFLARSGKLDAKRLAEFQEDPFFKEAPPKSLDRNHFTLAMVDGLSPEDGAATLTAMTASAIAKALEHVPVAPKQLLITGGGRHNMTLLSMIERYANTPVLPVEHMHWNGDALEAQAFAYLAARSVQGLALTLPTTTGVARPVTGGAFYPAARAGGSSALPSGAQ